MDLARCVYHGNAESVLFERGLGGVYAEAQETMRAVRVAGGLAEATNGLRAVRERILRQLAGYGWETSTEIFSTTAPINLQRGQYRLDASKRAGAEGALGFIFHVGSAEFTVRKLMLVSEAVRRRIVDCGIIALISRSVGSRLVGRRACYEQALKLLLSYGRSGFAGIPLVVWGLRPEAVQRESALATDLQVGDR